MKILGIKLTHDAGFALIDDNKLVFCYELEKLNNNPRHIDFNIDLKDIDQILKTFGYEVKKLDQIVIDGWNDDGWNQDGTNHFVETPFFKNIQFNGEKISVELAEYGYLLTKEKILKHKAFTFQGNATTYKSYPHTSGHIIGSYCTSPFAANREPADILLWDGSTMPQLCHFNGEFTEKGILFPLIGHVLVFFSTHYPPFNKCDFLDISVAGKIMAYIALGRPVEELCVLWNTELAIIMHYCNEKDFNQQKAFEITYNFVAKAVSIANKSKYSPEDILCSFHYFLQLSIADGLRRILFSEKRSGQNLCITGGCALNIKWNRSIRDLGIFENVWVPPFPNDSGSALGAACCEMVRKGNYTLQWDIYSGPPVEKNIPGHGWRSFFCSLRQLALLLHSSQEPVLFLNGRAELGPRALGNRSILASPINIEMKEKLNRIKQRESYRPIAPICLEEYGAEVFSPGCPDAYMLFDHKLNDGWKNKVPAICHLDNTARLQTVRASQNPHIYQLLTEYYTISGIPLLCNTSANYQGKGFFPDLSSASEWEGTLFIWCDEKLYCSEKIDEKTIVEWIT